MIQVEIRGAIEMQVEIRVEIGAIDAVRAEKVGGKAIRIDTTLIGIETRPLLLRPPAGRWRRHWRRRRG